MPLGERGRLGLHEFVNGTGGHGSDVHSPPPSPLGEIKTRVPETPRMVGKQLAWPGHATGREADQTLHAFVGWRVVMSRETNWRRHERDMVRRVVGRGGYEPGFVLEDAEIATM